MTERGAKRTPDARHRRRDRAENPTDRLGRLERRLRERLAEETLPLEELTRRFPAAMSADQGALARALASSTEPAEVAGMLRAHLGADNPRLWELLGEPLRDEGDRPRRRPPDDGVPEGRGGRAAAGRARGLLGVHLVWDRADAPTQGLVAELTDRLQTLGDGLRQDGASVLGEGVAVRHWPFATWPPARPRLEDFESNLVVLLLHSELPGGPGSATSSDWAQAVRGRSHTRVSVVVRLSAEHVSPPPRGLPGSGAWAVLWSEVAPETSLRPSRDAELSPIGPRQDAVAAVLWAVLLSLRQSGVRRVPVASDARGSRPLEATAFERRSCMPRFIAGPPAGDAELADRIVEPGGSLLPSGMDVEPPTDVLIVAAEADSEWRETGLPRVRVGPSPRAGARLAWSGPGRLTVETSDRPEEVLRGAHLVAARQAWLQACLERVTAGHSEWMPMVSPSLLRLRAAALRGRRWVLVPEPAPSASDRQQLAERASGLLVHSPTSRYGELLQGWTVHLTVCPPDGPTAARLGLPPNHGERVRRVLAQVFERAGARVQELSSAKELLEGKWTRTQLHVVGGLPAGPAGEAWLRGLRARVETAAAAVYPLGLCGGLFGGDAAPLDGVWPRALAQISDHNGLRLPELETLVRTVDTWPAARLVLEGVRRRGKGGLQASSGVR